MRSHRKKGPQRVSSLIDEVIRDLQPPADSWFDTLKDEWEQIVGPAVAAHAKPERIEGGALFVRVSSHIWQAELRGGLGAAILEKVRGQVSPDIRRIRWIT